MNRLTLSIALAATPLAAFSGVLVSQPSATTTDPALGSGTYVDGVFSDACSTQGGQFYSTTEADSFSLTSASTINSITFNGSSESNVDPSAGLSNLASFQIRILDAATNSLVYATSVATGSLTPTLTGATNYQGGGEYTFTLDTGTSLSLASGSYVLNIGAVENDVLADAFEWSFGSGGDASHLTDASFGDSYAASPNDLAFSVSGVQAVPEPTTLAALGLGALALLRRRKAA